MDRARAAALRAVAAQLGQQPQVLERASQRQFRAVALGDVLQALAQLCVAGRGLGEVEVGGAALTEVGGSKPLVKEEVAKRLQPGVALLVTRDGKGLDPYYAPVYKPGTLVVTLAK